ncbi:MAG: NADP-dependent isocitrate dehydrogenase [Betaproteobacteria bacterium]|jgi:isocitrate dehydrogenase|nr:NADP-dependent isocitrate dehydrogenase [Betaproteobacteria bacterium]
MDLADSRQLTRTAVAVAEGDGIGPEILAATMAVLDAAGARIDWQPIEVGEKVYKSGISAGIAPQAWEVLRRTGLLLKAPITTPQGGGYKSLNVTIRKSLGLYANVRPCVTYHPFVDTRHPGMDVVIVRENEEDLYAGIEHRQTDEVYQCLKLISRPGCERIVRYAFEYARANGRRKVTCFTKDNIMKMTDGLFHKVFDEIGEQYPELEKEHRIVDIGAALLADDPGRFDVVVMPNLYGDILSDVAAQIAGSIGLAGSSNIGDHVAMFEAVHGSAPDIAGKDVANPSGLIQAAAMLLAHIGQGDIATRVQNAWLRTIEDGVHTADVAGPHTREKVGTRAFAQAVIARLGQAPVQLKPVQFAAAQAKPAPAPARAPARKALVGVDVFLHWREGDAETLGAALNTAATGKLGLKMITNRGVKVWPGGLPETLCTDHWRCRFMPAAADATVTHADVVALLGTLAAAGFDFIKTEHLYTFDGVPGYSLGQGQ